jgi:putative endonuclease
LAISQQTGKKGEQMAAAYLQRQDYTLVATNWRWGRAEVDIIAKKDDVIVFVEVKTRKSTYMGQPEEFVSPHKVKMLTQAAVGYLQQAGHEWEFRFDVIAVVLRGETGASLRHFPDAFFQEWA